MRIPERLFTTTKIEDKTFQRNIFFKVTSRILFKAQEGEITNNATISTVTVVGNSLISTAKLYLS
jgi:hypothetical protein